MAFPAVLEVEVIADDDAQRCKLMNGILHECGIPRAVWREAPIRTTWVAEVVGRDPRHGHTRRFLRGKKDYSRANSMGSRGVYASYLLLPDRLYQVQHWVTWGERRRYWCRVVDGRIVTLTDEEAEAWLSARAN